MSKHTPGPWTVSSLAREGTRNTYVIDHAMSGVFTIEDANIIAAAPEMYEALENALLFIVNGVELGFIRLPDKGDPALDTEPKIRAAIAKAEGRS